MSNLIFSNGFFLIYQDQDVNLKERVSENRPNHSHWILKPWSGLRTTGMHMGLELLSYAQNLKLNSLNRRGARKVGHEHCYFLSSLND